MTSHVTDPFVRSLDCQAHINETIGRVFLGTQNFHEAWQSFQAALAIKESTLGTRATQTTPSTQSTQSTQMSRSTHTAQEYRLFLSTRDESPPASAPRPTQPTHRL